MFVLFIACAVTRRKVGVDRAWIFPREASAISPLIL
jgi:hypothetical protein